MQRPVDALVTGFTRSPELLARSLAPLQNLRQEGRIRAIRYVTWDSPDIDACVAPLRDLPDVQVTRVPQPDAQGTGNQRGVVYQVENLKAALTLVPDDALILKWRPDVVARPDFLRAKLDGFARNAAIPARAYRGVAMPPPVFQSKLWVPWADANSFFFFEDAVFLGERQDVAMLAVPPDEAEMAILGDPHCGSFAHVVRYAKPFLGSYPLFFRYLRNFRYFRHDRDYRLKQLTFALSDAFFWHMLAAHAWILHTQFHIDIGAPGDLAFYANAANRDADWSRFETLKGTAPYDKVAMWRDGTKPGEAIAGLKRVFGRLMDDAWPTALFTRDMPDLPPDTLANLLANVAECDDGRLDGIEAEFYAALDRINREELAAAPAA